MRLPPPSTDPPCGAQNGGTPDGGATSSASRAAHEGAHEGVVCTHLILRGSLLSSNIISEIESHFAHDAALTLERAAASHAAPRAIVLTLAPSQAPLMLPAELADQWAACLCAIEAAPLPTIFCAAPLPLNGQEADGGGEAAMRQLDAMSPQLNAISLELALACSARVAPPSASLSLVGWHQKHLSMMVPGPRVWQLARSCGVGHAARLLLCQSSANGSELLRWGLLDALITDDPTQTDDALASVVASVVASVAASTSSGATCAASAANAAVDSPHSSLSTTADDTDTTSDGRAGAACVDGSAMAAVKAELSLSDAGLFTMAAMPMAEARRSSAQWLREVISRGRRSRPADAPTGCSPAFLNLSRRARSRWYGAISRYCSRQVAQPTSWCIIIISSSSRAEGRG